jgi:hypothetical protein
MHKLQLSLKRQDFCFFELAFIGEAGMELGQHPSSGQNHVSLDLSTAAWVAR